MEIENFDTAEKISSDTQFVDLDPETNNENKNYVLVWSRIHPFLSGKFTKTKT